MHVHYTFDEFFCVLDRTFLFELDNEIFTLNVGDCLFIPRNVKHRFTYTGETSGTLLVGMTPAKNMEKYFAEMRNQLPDTGMLT
ncbi:MAG: cupin domain-containing protein [Agriterribacter sp.]